MDNHQLKAAVPSLFTLGNALCGFAAICLVAGGVPTPEGKVIACLLVLVGMFLDGFDGALARKFEVQSPFGSMLDTLADLVCYGAAPAVVMFALSPGPITGLAGAFYFTAALLRLARFTVNVELDEEAHSFFEGLPTTAAAGMMITTVLLVTAGEAGFLLAALPPLATLLGVLMISQLPYPHPLIRWRQAPETRWIFGVVLAVFVLMVPLKITLGATIVMTAYIASGVVFAILEPDEEEAGVGVAEPTSRSDR